MISVIGGKLTTAGRLAQDCMAELGLSSKKTTTNTVVPEIEIDLLLDRWTAGVAEAGGISQETARGMVEWFGKRALNIARRAGKSEDMRAPLCAHTHHIVAEVIDAFENECAATLADALLRRVPVALGACWSSQCSGAAAKAVSAAMGWNERRTREECEFLDAEGHAFLQRLT